MFSVSRGDILFEPIEWLIEGAFRFVLKIVFRIVGQAPGDDWGWMHWLIFIAILGFLLFLVALAIGRFAYAMKACSRYQVYVGFL